MHDREHTAILYVDLKYCDVSRIGSPDWLEVM